MNCSAVAISSAIAFAGTFLLRSIDASLAVGFSRLGADLMVVPGDAVTNITAALLTVEPTDKTLSADLFDQRTPDGVKRATPQRVFRTEHSGFGGHGNSADLIGFDPQRDFTVEPWIVERLPRATQPGDVILMINNQPVGSLKDFETIVGELTPDKAVALRVLRDGVTSFIAYTPQGSD